MSVVIALESPSGVVVGCDSWFGNEDTSDSLDREKWFTVGEVLVCWVGDARVPHAAEHAGWRHRRRRGEGAHSLVRRLAERLRALHLKRRVAVAETDYMFVCDGRVWLGDSYAVVTHSRHGYSAIGAGADFALGSLASTEGDPELRVQWALLAAERHSPKVAAPFRIHECVYGYRGAPALSVVR